MGVVPPSYSGAVITWTTCSFVEGGSSRLRLRMEDGATRGLGPPLHYYPPHIWIQCGPGGGVQVCWGVFTEHQEALGKRCSCRW